MPSFRHALWIAVIALVAVAIVTRIAFLRRVVFPTVASAPSAPTS